MENHYLVDILVLLAAAIIVVPLFKRLGLGSVLGYLVAGALVGPWGLGFIDKTEEIRHLAEFGVVFLLFIIGIELRPERLWSMRRLVFGLGTAQVMITGLVITSIALMAGQLPKTAVIIGFGLALSSTAFGLQILNERGEMGTTYGRTAFSVLLLQDLAVVPLLTLVSLLATKTPLLEGIEFAVLEALLVIALVILIGRFLLSPILRLVAGCQTPELFTAAAVFTVLGTAWLMEEAGLSLALGAFLAGLMMADSHYRHQVIADIEPFRGILLGLFFIGVGMSIDFGLLVEQSLLIAGLVIALLIIKASIIWGLSRVMKLGSGNATRVAMILSQSGEFGFVIFGLAAINGIIEKELFNIMVLLIALSMVTTPLMVSFGESLAKRIGRKKDESDVSTEHLDADSPHVIIAGFGRVGRRIAKIMRAGNVPYLAIEGNSERVLEGRKDGFSVFYGDASDGDVLKAAGAKQAGVIVCTLDNSNAAIRLVKILRQYYADICIHARAHDRKHCIQLLDAGASIAISETLEASVQISVSVLDTIGVYENEINTLIEGFREEEFCDSSDDDLRKL